MKENIKDILTRLEFPEHDEDSLTIDDEVFWWNITDILVFDIHNQDGIITFSIDDGNEEAKSCCEIELKTEKNLLIIRDFINLLKGKNGN